MSAKRKPHIRVISFLLALCLCVSLAGCGDSSSKSDTGSSSAASSADSSQTSSDPKRVGKIVEEMVVDYGSYGSEAKDRIDNLLGELSACDTSAGKRWKNIMDIWTSDDLGKKLNYDVLPDGLPDTDELCIVVLGFQLNPDGTMKDELIQRLTVALNSAKKYPKACTPRRTLSAPAAALHRKTKLHRKQAKWQSG